MPKESLSTMTMRRIRMKFHAKRALPGNWLRSMFLALLFVLTTTFTLSMILPPIDPELLQEPPSTYAELLKLFFPNPITKNFLLLVGVLLLLYWLVVSPLRVGLSRFFIGVARLQKPKLPTAFAVFCDLGLVLRSMGLSFLVGFLRLFWLIFFLLLPACVMYAALIMQSALLADVCLLIYPLALILYTGKALAYAPATYLFANDPSVSVFGAVKQSVKITRGHLTEFFCLELSFLLWRVFASLAGLIGILFFLPYYHTTMAVFVDSLRVRNDPSLAPQSEEEPQDE